MPKTPMAGKNPANAPNPIDVAIQAERDFPRGTLYLDGDLMLGEVSIPPGVFGLTHIVALSISGSYSDNRTGITELPSDIKKLRNLKTLVLQRNMLKRLPKELFEIESLEELYLAHNEITELPAEIFRLSGLKRLDLSDNRLTALPAAIGTLTRLQTLELDGNHISALPLEIGNLQQLVRLSVGDNRIENVPLEILHQSARAIVNYCKSILDDPTSRVFEAKLLLVGEGGVGKTSLQRRLIDHTFDRNEGTTEGIDIRRWLVPTSMAKNFLVNVWDFGGQEIYHATHQFFLTQRSLYLFVWTARNDEIRFDYWLNVIQLLSNASPVIVVLAKTDERIKLIDENLLRQRFPNIVAYERVSALSGVGIDSLTNTIQQFIIRLEHIGSVLPTAWVEIRQHLESLSVNYIEYKDYKDICRASGLDEKKADFLSRYYHDLGVFLHFQDHPLLRQMVFLKPEWATSAVYRLVDTKEVVRANGRFRFEQLRTIWADYPEDKHPYLVALMQKFELCFAVPDSDIYIVPELLSPSSASLDWSYENNLGFEYRYEFMPSGIISRFIVLTHHLIEESLFWKHGAILRREGNRALVIGDPFLRMIRIWISGSRKKELLAIVREKIDYIHSTLNNPKVKEMVHCCCSECTSQPDPFVFEYRTLLNFYLKGRRTVACSVSAEDVEIEVLLGEIQHGKRVEEELLSILRDLKQKLGDEERVIEQANKIIQLQPNFFGVGINLNELIRRIFKRSGQSPEKVDPATESDSDETKLLSPPKGKKARRRDA